MISEPIPPTLENIFHRLSQIVSTKINYKLSQEEFSELMEFNFKGSGSLMSMLESARAGMATPAQAVSEIEMEPSIHTPATSAAGPSVTATSAASPSAAAGSAAAHYNSATANSAADPFDTAGFVTVASQRAGGGSGGGGDGGGGALPQLSFSTLKNTLKTSYNSKVNKGNLYGDKQMRKYLQNHRLKYEFNYGKNKLTRPEIQDIYEILRMRSNARSLGEFEFEMILEVD